MAKNRYGKKRGKKSGGHRKSAKRSAAARKAWRTRKRNAAVCGTFGGSSRRKRGASKKSVSAKRRAAGHRLWRAMIAKHGSKAKAVAFLQRKRRQALGR